MASLNIIGETEEKWVLKRTYLDRSMIIDKSVAPIEQKQVLAFDEATGKLVKYDKAGAGTIAYPFTVYTGESKETITEDFKGTVLAFGSVVDKSKIVGIEEADIVGKHRLYLAGIMLEEVNG